MSECREGGLRSNEIPSSFEYWQSDTYELEFTSSSRVTQCPTGGPPPQHTELGENSDCSGTTHWPDDLTYLRLRLRGRRAGSYYSEQRGECSGREDESTALGRFRRESSRVLT